MSAPNNSQYIHANDTPVLCLDAVTAFKNLTFEEQLYAHHLSKASWLGSLIVLFQTSSESPLIFSLVHRLFTLQSIDQLKALALKEADFTENEWRAFLVYVSAFYSNMGNYRGYGDTKFIPNLPQDKLEKLIHSSQAYKRDSSFVQFIWNNIKNKMFSLNSDELSLGFKPTGTTTYWSKNMTKEDEEIVKKFLAQNNIEAYNTRALKDTQTGNYIIRFASILNTNDFEERDYLDQVKMLNVDGHQFRLERGDYSSILKLVNKNLEQAQKFARNSIEKGMIGEYIRHFRSGSLKAHKEGSRFWIKDKGPIVESYIGFIENYRDPGGERAEFEGFVAVVNKEMSKKFTHLVEKADQLLPLLPWPKTFEKDKFLKPDFTSLDVLTFSGSGIPAGINIPNYDEIRQNEGFKNVSLGNVIKASFNESKPNFLSKDNAELLKKYGIASFEICVGLHELLGHGSGKILRKNQNGTFNFDHTSTIDPLSGKQVTKWYESNETYDSKFSSLSSPYEECRAECVALYLSLNQEVLKIFGFIDLFESQNVVYVSWLSMVHKGIESLKMYNSSVNKWLQAHSQARYVITRVLLESAKECITIEQIEKSPIDGQPDLLINFTRDFKLIETKGKNAIGDFLQKLQVFKSTGDFEAASKMFEHYSEVSDDLEYPFLKLREIVLARKKPRPIYVESSTSIHESTIQLNTYEPTHEGLIQSFQDHFNSFVSNSEPSDSTNIETILIDLWKSNSLYF